MKSRNAGTNSGARSREAQACPACGMARASWPEAGYVLEGVEYCCKGCAEGAGCTCFQQGVGGTTARPSDIV
jgi:hypothetical protein